MEKEERILQIFEWLKDGGCDPSIFNTLSILDYGVKILGIITISILVICQISDFIISRKFETKFDKRFCELENDFITLSTRVKNLEIKEDE